MGCCVTKDGVHRSNTIYLTVDQIPKDYIARHKILPCQVVNVSDGDTIRVRHTPHAKLGENGLKSFPEGTHWKTRAKAEPWRFQLRSQTLLIRIYAVDAPETTKGQKRGQPYAEEATDFVKDLVLEQVVHVKLLSVDQYGRLLAAVKYRNTDANNACCLHTLFGRVIEGDLSEELLRRGYATVYRGRGGVYDGHDHSFDVLEARAKKEKRGMWSLPSSARITPGEYKAAARVNDGVHAEIPVDDGNENEDACDAVGHGGDDCDGIDTAGAAAAASGGNQRRASGGGGRKKRKRKNRQKGQQGCGGSTGGDVTSDNCGGILSSPDDEYNQDFDDPNVW